MNEHKRSFEMLYKAIGTTPSPTFNDWCKKSYKNIIFESEIIDCHPHTIYFNLEKNSVFLKQIDFREGNILRINQYDDQRGCKSIFKFKLKNIPMKIKYSHDIDLNVAIYSIDIKDADHFASCSRRNMNFSSTYNNEILKYCESDIICYNYHKSHECRNGSTCYLHRINKPAFFFRAFGELNQYTEIYFYFGMIHRPVKLGPAITIKILENKGLMKREKWVEYNQIHNNRGPAEIEFFNDKITYFCFSVRGVIHRPQHEGPAILNYDSEKNTYYLYYLENGKFCSDKCLIILNYRDNTYEIYDINMKRYINLCFSKYEGITHSEFISTNNYVHNRYAGIGLNPNMPRKIMGNIKNIDNKFKIQNII